MCIMCHVTESDDQAVEVQEMLHRYLLSHPSIGANLARLLVERSASPAAPKLRVVIGAVMDDYLPPADMKLLRTVVSKEAPLEMTGIVPPTGPGFVPSTCFLCEREHKVAKDGVKAAGKGASTCCPVCAQYMILLEQLTEHNNVLYRGQEG